MTRSENKSWLKVGVSTPINFIVSDLNDQTILTAKNMLEIDFKNVDLVFQIKPRKGHT